MSELIRKQDAIKAICEDGTWLERQGCTEITMVERKQRDVDIIENLPPVQPTIIRCRDCKYSIDVYNDGDCYCKRPSRELVWIGKSWDFFCKAGDKRGGEAE